jgi:hypothetical protein
LVRVSTPSGCHRVQRPLFSSHTRSRSFSRVTIDIHTDEPSGKFGSKILYFGASLEVCLNHRGADAGVYLRSTGVGQEPNPIPLPEMRCATAPMALLGMPGLSFSHFAASFAHGGSIGRSRETSRLDVWRKAMSALAFVVRMGPRADDLIGLRGSGAPRLGHGTRRNAGRPPSSPPIWRAT